MPQSELVELRRIRKSIDTLEEALANARLERDRTIRAAVARKIPERAIAVEAGVSRGWVFRCKNASP